MTAPNVGYPNGVRSLHLAPLRFTAGRPVLVGS